MLLVHPQLDHVVNGFPNLMIWDVLFRVSAIDSESGCVICVQAS